MGEFGEKIARQFLEKKKLKFCEKNFCAAGGEIDLIFFDIARDEFVFVEVKIRTNTAFGDGASAITSHKFQKILAAAEFFFAQKNFEKIPNFRIDAIILRLDRGKIFCQHLQNLGETDF